MFGSLGTLLLVLVVLLFTGRPSVTLSGIDDGRTYGASALPTGVTIGFDRPVRSVVVLLDGRTVPVIMSGLEASASLGSLTDGEHKIRAEVARGSLSRTVRLDRTFVVDSTAPVVEILDPLDPVAPNRAFTMRLLVDDPTAKVFIDGSNVVAGTDGFYRQNYESPPVAPIRIVATDTVGNATTQDYPIVLDLPGIEGGPSIRGVHASGYTWSSSVLKDPIMQMISRGLINTIEIDLKDENGEIWYNTSVGLAHEIGAVTELWDLGTVVEELHSLGVRVIGRLVVFRDAKLANYAVEQGRMDLVVQKPDGSAYGQYGGFTNPFNTVVWEYNISIAEEAALLGVDDILYDYVRRPDQNIATMRFPGQGDAKPEDAIIGFLEASFDRLHKAGARLGASVFGIAAHRPDEIAQNIPRMATTVDYIAPMVYPSHWGPNEYGVENPNAQPYDITYRSLSDFQDQVSGTGATLLAWLQDFSLGIDYGPTEVRAQIEAAADAGVVDFLLWDAAATYTSAALSPAS